MFEAALLAYLITGIGWTCGFNGTWCIVSVLTARWRRCSFPFLLACICLQCLCPVLLRSNLTIFHNYHCIVADNTNKHHQYLPCWHSIFDRILSCFISQWQNILFFDWLPGGRYKKVHHHSISIVWKANNLEHRALWPLLETMNSNLIFHLAYPGCHTVSSVDIAYNDLLPASVS